MLRKSSVSMMLLIIAASLVGISSIYQYNEAETPPAATYQPQQQAQRSKYVQGMVTSVLTYASSDGKACLAMVDLPANRPNNLGLKPGSTIELLAPDESLCTSLGLAKIGKGQMSFQVALPHLTVKVIPLSLLDEFPTDYELLYRVLRVRM
jgi:hypothetical protein